MGIVVQECLQYLGIQSDHIAIRTSYRGMRHYEDMIKNSAAIRVHGLEYLEGRLESEHRLLLVDDVFSSGHSIQAVKEKLRRKLRRNMPEDTRVAAVWYRSVAGRPAPRLFCQRNRSLAGAALRVLWPKFGRYPYPQGLGCAFAGDHIGIGNLIVKKISWRMRAKSMR